MIFVSSQDKVSEPEMSQKLETNNQITPWSKQVGLLVAGDLLAFLLFVGLGRNSHSLSVTDLGAVFSTAAPFVFGWFLVSPWFGLFSAEVNRSWQKLIPRLLLAWLGIGGPVALLLWAVWRGRAIPYGIVPSFALVTLGITTAFLLIWRLSYIWWVNRS